MRDPTSAHTYLPLPLISRRRIGEMRERRGRVGLLLGWLAACSLVLGVAAAPRLTVNGSDLSLDGKLFQLRAVLYSPTPWGYDDDLFYRTASYSTVWPALFARDLDLIASLGANAVRIHGFLGVASDGGKHDAFLEAAQARQLSVLLTYEMRGYGPNAVKLSTAAERSGAVADLRFFVRAARHPAIVLLFLGSALNRSAPPSALPHGPRHQPTPTARAPR